FPLQPFPLQDTLQRFAHYHLPLHGQKVVHFSMSPPVQFSMSPDTRARGRNQWERGPSWSYTIALPRGRRVGWGWGAGPQAHTRSPCRSTPQARNKTPDRSFSLHAPRTGARHRETIKGVIYGS